MVRGSYPLGYDCQSDFLVVGKVAEAESDLRKRLGQACGGNNHTCSTTDTGRNADETLASIGWDIGVCPDFESAGCTNPIADCNDIAACMACTATVATSQAIELYDGSLNVPAPDRPLTTCQREIGKRGVEFFWKKHKALEKCERKILSGDVSGPCPDAGTQHKIDTLALKMTAAICKKCGGADKQCGGAAADRTLTEIGFPSTCPNVTIPGGAACGGGVATVAELGACIDCVTEFKVDCLDALSVPGMKAYPAECTTVP